MANKYLDSNGLLYLWGKIKAKFATKDEVAPLTSASHTHTNKTILDATTASYTTTEKTKLAGIATGANKYVLPTATASTLGGVKIGNNITNTDGTLSINGNNVTNALGYTPAASTDMIGATANTDGTHGLVPAPTKGKQTSFLRGDGTWVVPTNTTYSDATTSNHGLMTAAMVTKLDNIEEGANKTIVDAALSTTSTNPVQNKIINTALGTKIDSSTKGVAGGVATLDADGLVPSSQLPSYVDDVIEGYYYNSKFYKESSHATLITGETGKIYVDVSTNLSYRYSGTVYVLITSTDMVAITNAEIDIIVAS